MIQITENWALSSDRYQWILARRAVKKETYAKLPAETRRKRKEFSSVYYYPHLKDVMHRLAHEDIWTSKFDSVIQLEELMEKTLEDVVDRLKLNREGMQELLETRYG